MTGRLLPILAVAVLALAVAAQLTDRPVFILAVGVLIAAIGARGVPQLWRGCATEAMTPPPWWLWSERAWAAWVRGTPVGSAGFGILVLVAIVGNFLPEEPWAGFARPWWFVLPALTLFGAVTTLLVSIALFNRPKRLVPPHLRDAPGLWDDRRRRQQAG